MLEQVVTFVVAIISLAVLGAAFAFVLYLLIQNRLGKTNTLTVMQEGVEEALPGLPFYVKHGRLTHETSYLETLATLTLVGDIVELDDQGKVVKTESDFSGVRTVSLSPEMMNAIATLQAELNLVQQAQICSKQASRWESVKSAFTHLTAYTGAEPDYDLPLESNALFESAYVDYGTRFFLNKVQPLSGSSDIDITLASDGTLTKAVGKSTDNTFEKLLGFMPKTDSLLDKGKATSPAAASEAQTKGAVPRDPSAKVPAEQCQLLVSLKVEHQYVRHVWFKDVPTRSYEDPVTQNQTGYWYRREIVAEAEEPTPAPSPKKEA